MNRISRLGLLQFARYLCVGGSTAVVYFVILPLAVEVFHFEHMLAVSVSFFGSTVFHFLANRAFTFKSRNANVVGELTRYGCVVLVNYVITLIVVHGVVDLAGQSTYLGAAVAIAVTVGLGYGMTKFWVFRQTRGSL